MINNQMNQNKQIRYPSPRIHPSDRMISYEDAFEEIRQYHKFNGFNKNRLNKIIIYYLNQEIFYYQDLGTRKMWYFLVKKRICNNVLKRYNDLYN